MHALVDVILVLVLLLNLMILGESRLRSVIHSSAAQGIMLGLLLVIGHGATDTRALVVGLASMGIKGIVIPMLLLRAVRDAGIRRDVEPFISFTASLLLGAVGTGLALFFARTLPLAPEHAATAEMALRSGLEHQGTLIVPASLATVLTGFLILTTRKKAITQVVGYLTLENGVFIFGQTLHDAMPFVVEVGVLLDLVVGIFVFGIVIDHINSEFSTINTEKLANLKG